MPHADPQILTILGAGEMGHGIAQLAATKGLVVRLRDIDAGALGRAREKVEAGLRKLAAKGRLTVEEAEAARARVTYTTDLQAALEGANAIIEAVPERLGLKQKVMSEVEAYAPADALLATNTSGMRITEIAQAMQEPGRLVGMHFFNPVHAMDLVEVIPGDETPPEVRDRAVALSRALGKRVVVCERDVPGFITTRLVGAYFNAAAWLLQKGLATTEEVDSALRFKAGWPMGPFELADLTGLDIARDSGNYLQERLGESARTAPVIETLVSEGRLGRKSGRGFYDHSEAHRPRFTPEAAGGFDPARVLAVVANEAAKLVEQGVAPAAEIDEAMRLGCGFPKGPLEWADDVGLDKVLMTLLDLKEALGIPIHEPSDLLVDLVRRGHVGKRSGQGFHAHAGKTTPAAPGTSPAPAPATASKGAEPSASGVPGATALGPVLLAIDREIGVATLAINRPQRHNALNAEVLEALRTAVEACADEPAVRVILLRGVGEKAFCSGADLGDPETTTPVSAMALARRGHALTNAIEKCGKPVIAALNGHALGGGLELALACDFRIAAARAELGLPEVGLGLLPAMGGTQRLPKLVGLAKAKELILLGGRVSAEDALRLNLVTRVVENERFDEETANFAIRLAHGAPLAQALAKQALHVAMTADPHTGQEFEAAAFGMLLGTQDGAEGVRAFLARSQPEFKGK